MENINEKYTEILNQGKILFWKHGLKKVTVDEICKKAKTSRVTFYKYFQNKEQLAFTILKSVMDDSWKEYEEIMESDSDFMEKAEKTIQMKIKNSQLMSHELSHDILEGDFPEIKKLISKMREKTFSRVENDYREAQNKGHIRSDIKIEFIMYLLNKMQEMIYDPELERHYADSGGITRELIQFFFYGILSPDNRKDNSK